MHDHLQSLFRSVLNNPNLVLTDDMSAVDIPEWDSVAHINLMFSIEREFGVQFAGNELAEMKNLRELKRYLIDKGCPV